MDQIDIELRKHRFIVFSQDHYNPLGIIRRLGEKDLKPISILYGENQWMIPHCRYVDTLFQVETLEEGYRLLLDKYGKEVEKPFVLCSDDTTTSYLDQHFDELKDHFYCYNANEKGRITWLQNKDNITNLAEESGLLTPKKEVVETGILPQKLHYPIITKVLASTMGAWKGDVYICKNENELIDAYKLIQSPLLILQEYIHKKGEFCMEGFSINNGEDVFIPYIAEYIRYYYNSYGHYMNMIPFPEGDFRRKIIDLLRRTKYNGIFEIEFMKGPSDENYFLEVNFRASTWNYAITVGGGNLPYYWAKSLLAGRVLLDEMELRKDSFTAMVEPDDFVNNVIKLKTISLFQWLKEWKTTDCFYYYNKNDKKPYIYYWVNRIKRLILRRL